MEDTTLIKPAAAPKDKFTHKDRMMKKMQALLNKQHKIDRKAQKAKEKLKKAAILDRAEELREHQQRIKEAVKEEPAESAYTFSGAAETYKDDDSPPPRTRSSSPNSPHRILTEECRRDPKDNGRHCRCRLGGAKLS